MQLARAFARHLSRLDDVKLYPADPYGPRVRNAAEAAEHGWMDRALATVTYEAGLDLIDVVGEWTPPESDFYFECQNSCIVGVYRK